ncbi:MAG TPA: hypothetical protein VNF50_00175 [Acidimicrobiales bacterium]|nr:hypothetical protein [Acidimicrobiales bacterium]
MPLDQSPAAGDSAFRSRPCGRHARLPAVGHQTGRALVATLAGTIAVLGSVAGSTAFVMQSMKSAPDMSVSVAPVITLRPAASKGAAAGPTVSGGSGPVAARAPSITAPAPAGAGAELAAPALRPEATPALTNRLLAAAQAPAVVRRAVSTVTGAVAQAAGATTKPVTAVATKPATAASAKPATAVATKPATAVATQADARAHSGGDHSPRATVALSQIDSARKIQGGGHRLWAETDGLNGPSTHH